MGAHTQMHFPSTDSDVKCAYSYATLVAEIRYEGAHTQVAYAATGAQRIQPRHATAGMGRADAYTNAASATTMARSYRMQL